MSTAQGFRSSEQRGQMSGAGTAVFGDAPGPAGAELLCDDSQRPIVVVQMPAVWASPAQLEAVLQQLVLCQRREAVLLVLDVRGAARPTAAERGLIAKAMSDERRHELLGIAVVSTSLLARAVVLALVWRTPARTPVAFFDNREAALAWAGQRTTGVPALAR